MDLDDEDNFGSSYQPDDDDGNDDDDDPDSDDRDEANIYEGDDLPNTASIPQNDP